MSSSIRNRFVAIAAITAAVGAGAAVAQSSAPATPAEPSVACPGGQGAGCPGAGARGMQPGHGMHGQSRGHGMHGQQDGHGHRGPMARHGEERGARGDRMFMRHDADGDGKVSRAELEAAHRSMAERTMKAFDAADTDRDGALTVEERRAFRESMRAQAGAREGWRRRGSQPGTPGRSAPAAPPVPGA